jgi:VIT1/CCC1 family predicted Fe2+/Mn2+ transporter
MIHLLHSVGWAILATAATAVVVGYTTNNTLTMSALRTVSLTVGFAVFILTL